MSKVCAVAEALPANNTAATSGAKMRGRQSSTGSRRPKPGRHQGTRAPTHTLTSAAPARSSVAANSLPVCPLVIPSSTTATLRPTSAPFTRNAPLILRQRRPHPLGAAPIQRNTLTRGQRARKFQRLIEAALAQSAHMERNRHDDIRAEFRTSTQPGLRHQLAQQPGQRKPPAELQPLDQRIQRRLIEERRLSATEAARSPLAAAAESTDRQRQGAAATTAAQPRQLGPARRAQFPALFAGAAA